MFGLGWDTFRFSGATLGGNASRQATDGWTLEPINDPQKLELMRCAYQKAVANCGRGGESTACPDCQANVAAFYGPEYSASENRVHATYDCFEPGCCTWFAYGPKECVPKCGCSLVGKYCGTYVWILPGGEDELTKLTLTILDFAVNSFPSPRMKQVTMYRREVVRPDRTVELEPATESTATQVTVVAVPTTTDATQVLVDPVIDPQAEAKRRFDKMSDQERRSLMKELMARAQSSRDELGPLEATELPPVTMDSADLLNTFVEEKARQIEQETAPSTTVRPQSSGTGLGLDPFQFRQDLNILAPPTGRGGL
jgi:hypothetical protein